MSRAGWACRTSPTCAGSGSRWPGRRCRTGSTISGWSSAASSMPMSCSAARASWRWPRACRMRSGPSAARRDEHRSDSLSAAFRNLAPEVEEDWTARYDAPVRPLWHGRQPQQSRRRPRERRDRGAARPSQERASRTRCCCAARATSTPSPTIARFVDELVGRRNARNRKRIDAERAVLRPLPAGAPTTARRRWSR